jgi:hypothetical protein
VKVVERPGQVRPKFTIVSETRRGGRFEPPATGWVSFEEADFSDVDLSGLQLQSFHASRSRFTDCDFSGLRTGAVPRLGGCRYVRCTFDRADLRRANFELARFEHCSFRNARIENWNSGTGEFIECTFEGKMRHVQFWGRPNGPFSVGLKPPRKRNEFHANDFRNAELWDVEFRAGIDLDAQLLPAGPEYIKLDRIIERARLVRPAIEAWPAGEERKLALARLDMFADPARHADQRIMFVNRNDFRSLPAAVSDRVWAALETALPAA